MFAYVLCLGARRECGERAKCGEKRPPPSPAAGHSPARSETAPCSSNSISQTWRTGALCDTPPSAPSPRRHRTPLTHSLTHSLLTHSLTCSLTCSLTHLLSYPLTHASLTPPPPPASRIPQPTADTPSPADSVDWRHRRSRSPGTAAHWTDAPASTDSLCSNVAGLLSAASPAFRSSRCGLCTRRTRICTALLHPYRACRRDIRTLA